MQELITFLNHHSLLSLATLGVLILIALVEIRKSKKNSFNISTIQAIQLINKQNAAVVDTRTQDAFAKGRIIGSQSISAQDLQKNTKKLEKFKNRPIIIVSNTQVESQKIAVFLLKQGYNAYSLLGGIKAWNDAQMPLVKE